MLSLRKISSWPSSKVVELRSREDTVRPEETATEVKLDNDLNSGQNNASIVKSNKISTLKAKKSVTLNHKKKQQKPVPAQRKPSSSIDRTFRLPSPPSPAPLPSSVPHPLPPSLPVNPNFIIKQAGMTF